MKNQQMDSTILNDIVTNLSLDQSKQILCSNNKSSSLVCLTKNCQKYAFMCNNQECSCQKQHQFCLKLVTNAISKNMLSKVFSLNHIAQQFVQKIQQSIDFLSNLKQKFMNQLTNSLKYFGLNQNQMHLVKSLESGNVDSLTGKIIWQTIVNAESNEDKNKIQKLTNDTRIQFNKTINKLDQQISSFQASIKNILEKLKVSELKVTVSQNNRSYKIKQLFKESKIVKQDKLNNLVNFFETKQINATKLLYRASQHQFLTSKFYEKCSYIPNTITICETQYGKIIGGYTPLYWCKSEKDEDVIDKLKQSFIFSLTNNDKLTLTKQIGICRRVSSPGVLFSGSGNWDLFISNKSDESSTSGSNLGYAYVNEKYSKGKKQSFERFCGNPQSYRFKIKQWQVWQLQFK